jgi:hypothetical protein
MDREVKEMEHVHNPDHDYVGIGVLFFREAE